LWVAFAALIASTYFYAQSIRGPRRRAGAGAPDLRARRVRPSSWRARPAVPDPDARTSGSTTSSRTRICRWRSPTWFRRFGPARRVASSCAVGGLLLGLPLVFYAATTRTARARLQPDAAVAARHPAAPVAVPLSRRPAAGTDTGGRQGLNPLLQNPWMTIHPADHVRRLRRHRIPFAFAIAALWGRRYDEWVSASMPWR